MRRGGQVRRKLRRCAAASSKLLRIAAQRRAVQVTNPLRWGFPVPSGLLGYYLENNKISDLIKIFILTLLTTSIYLEVRLSKYLWYK